jgi:hypothetical protein
MFESPFRFRRRITLTLFQFFTIWSETTQGHEVDRSFKRSAIFSY